MVDGVKPHVGGPIAGPGVPTVLIGGMPAAVQGDICTCAGAPDTITLGSSGVLIGGKPAARMGDLTAHGGTIILGCPTVLIGETAGGSGGAGGGNGGMLETERSPDTVIPVMPGGGGSTPGSNGGGGGGNQPPPVVVDKGEIGFTLVDPQGTPLENIDYEVTLPDGSIRTGKTDKKGVVLIKGIKPGKCKISFPNLHADEWH